MRPLIAIPARFSASTSALRMAAEVNARALVEAVWRAGGEPATIHPADPAYEDVVARLARFDGVLLPGGGDLAPHRYGSTETHQSVYDVDHLQDAFDLAVARHTLAAGIPLLAICRGLQVVNVALGGSLHQDMGGPDHEHRPRLHPVTIRPGTLAAHSVGADKVEASCYHHQQVDRLGNGLTVTAIAEDGTIEALELPSAPGWFTAVQWHPEDTAHTDRSQQNLFDALIRNAAAGERPVRQGRAGSHQPRSSASGQRAASAPARRGNGGSTKVSAGAVHAQHHVGEKSTSGGREDTRRTPPEAADKTERVE